MEAVMEAVMRARAPAEMLDAEAQERTVRELYEVLVVKPSGQFRAHGKVLAWLAEVLATHGATAEFTPCALECVACLLEEPMEEFATDEIFGAVVGTAWFTVRSEATVIASLVVLGRLFCVRLDNAWAAAAMPVVVKAMETHMHSPEVVLACARLFRAQWGLKYTQSVVDAMATQVAAAMRHHARDLDVTEACVLCVRALAGCYPDSGPLQQCVLGVVQAAVSFADVPRVVVACVACLKMLAGPHTPVEMLACVGPVVANVLARHKDVGADAALALHKKACLECLHNLAGLVPEVVVLTLPVLATLLTTQTFGASTTARVCVDVLLDIARSPEHAAAVVPYLPHVCVAFEHNMSDSGVVHACAGLVKVLARGSRDYAVACVPFIPMLVEALGRWSNNTFTAPRLVRACRELARVDGSRMELGAVLPGVLKVLWISYAWKNAEVAVVAVCRSLSGWLDHCSAFTNTVHDLGRILTTIGYLSFELASDVLGVFHNLSRYFDSRVWLMAAVPYVARVLDRFGRAPEVVLTCVEFVRNLACHPGNAGSGRVLLEVLVPVLKRAFWVEAVVQACVVAIANLAAFDDGPKACVLRLVPNLWAAVAHFPDNTHLTELCIGCFCNLATDGDAATQLLGTVPLLLRLLSGRGTDEDLAESCAAYFAVLAGFKDLVAHLECALSFSVQMAQRHATDSGVVSSVVAFMLGLAAEPRCRPMLAHASRAVDTAVAAHLLDTALALNWNLLMFALEDVPV
jgi:hypothetical protein